VTRARRATLAALLALSALWIGSTSVAAHALLLSSEPAANAVVATAPTAVRMTFTEPPDLRLSSVRVLDVSGANHASGAATADAGDAATLTVPVETLADGVYTVAWRTVSSVDGHTAAGSFAFSVGAGTPPAGQGPSGRSGSLDAAGTSSVSPASVAARAATYLGLIALLGALLTSGALVGERARRSGGLAPGGWLLAVAGSVAILVTQAADAGVSVADALDSSLGADLWLRLVPLLAAGPALLAAARVRSWRRPAMSIAVVLVALALLADAVASHAATVVAPPLNVGLQWLHAMGVAVWLGGLVGLLLELRDPDLEGRARLVARFSRWATVGILLVAVTGVVRAAFELHSPGELTSTDYGRLLVAKLALFGCLAALGAVNHFRNVPGGERRVASVQRLGSLEVLLGTTAIVVASLLVTTPPPGDLAGVGSVPGGAPATPPPPSAPPAMISLQGADYATTVRVGLTITPGTPGPATFRASVVDYDTGDAVAVTGLKLRFVLPSHPEIGPSTLTLGAAADGAYTGTGSNLSLAGTWTVTAVVTEPTTSVEAPMSVAIAATADVVDVDRVTGQPTLYTVHLGGGDEAQLYLDPLEPGTATLHITYFDAAGRELPVNGIAVVAAQEGSAPAPLQMFPLEPGHSTARVATRPGVSIALVVTGIGPGGATITFPLAVAPDP
jgi:copper transport protein